VDVIERVDGIGRAGGIASEGNEAAAKFAELLLRFPREDGEPWRPVEIEAATGGRVTSSYVSALKKGKFKKPGIRQLELIAQAMGFPFELWLTEPELWDEIPGGRPLEPVEEIAELGEREKAVVQVMRSLDDRRQDAVLAVARQLAAL
jgi:transcriptional regulator with XRE-family HTH domain